MNECLVWEKILCKDILDLQSIDIFCSNIDLEVVDWSFGNEKNILNACKKRCFCMGNVLKLLI